MSDFAIIYPLAGITLLLAIVFGVQQVRRMQQKRHQENETPSSLAEDGDAHRKQEA